MARSKTSTKKADPKAAKKKPAAKATAAKKPAAKATAAKKPAAKATAANKPASSSANKPAATSGAGAAFAGFPPQTLQFLADLAVENDRAWFEANKARYEQFVLAPALAFIVAMRPRLAKISKHFQAIDKKVGGSLMRIHRDTRFSADKSPYKTNIGIQFRHVGGEDIHAPGFYVHIEPGQAFIGCGMWHPDKEPLHAVRKAIAESPAAWKKAISGAAFVEHFDLGGESLARPPKDFDPAHPYIEDIKRKDFIAGAELPTAALHDAELLDLVATRFDAVAPFVKFLCGAVGAAF